MVSAFLSYSRKDSEFTTKLYNDLVSRAIKVWLDTQNIPYGKNWDDVIDEVLRREQITHFLVVLSITSVQSENVRDEIGAARSRGIEFIIPLIIEECDIPFRLLRKNHINFMKLGYDAALQELLKAFQQSATDVSENIILQADALVLSVKTSTAEQLAAAQDTKPQVRLMAGPGTGKSFVIEERVVWLLEKNVESHSIFVISFTRNASRDLRKRIEQHGVSRNITRTNLVSVTTLHSLALKALRKSKALNYPVDPRVLDKWELENIFDQECAAALGKTAKRCAEMREAYEAFWVTGMWDHPNYDAPQEPITTEEQTFFLSFHTPATLTYACVLPGEIVHKAVERIRSGLLDPATLLGIKHLIVDEFQDLNNSDLELVDAVAQTPNTVTFVAGDDDQSLYSFRYASPSGVREFPQKYPQTSDHKLERCFRCTPIILRTATTLIEKYSDALRVPKSLVSHFADQAPPIDGIVHRWSFKSGKAEAEAIAESCRSLIAKGVEPREILILISNRKVLLTTIEEAFTKYDVEFELPSDLRYIDSNDGRFAFALLRLACDTDLEDFFAHRLILGLPKGIGIGTCNSIRRKVVQYNLTYLDVFYRNRSSLDAIFDSRELRAIDQAREICTTVIEWNDDDSLEQRSGEIENLLANVFKDDQTTINWRNAIQHLPPQMTLAELRDYFGSNNDEERLSILEATFERLGIDTIPEALFPRKVRIMTMHGVKGLNAQVVFIPGLEEDILPGDKRKDKPGLIYEAARLLYVSITRARAACILSYSKSRTQYGKYVDNKAPSTFNAHLAGRFGYRENGFTNDEVMEITQTLQSIQANG